MYRTSVPADSICPHLTDRKAGCPALRLGAGPYRLVDRLRRYAYS